MDYLFLYKETLLCAALASVVLALIGVHLAARDRALHSLSVSQGASLALLLGLGWIGFHTDEWWLPYAFGFLGGGAVYYLAERVLRHRLAVPNTYLLSSYLLLLAATYWVIAYFPSLEAHFSQAFFGDIVTLGGARLYLLAVVALATGGVTFFKHSDFIRETVQRALFSESQSSKKDVLFSAVVLSLLVTCIFTLGLLFTVSFLFLPTLIFAWNGKGSLRHHLVKVALLAPVSVIVGFVVSLHWERFSTIPTIVLTLFVLGLLVRVLERLISAGKSC